MHTFAHHQLVRDRQARMQALAERRRIRSEDRRGRRAWVPRRLDRRPSAPVVVLAPRAGDLMVARPDAAA